MRLSRSPSLRVEERRVDGALARSLRSEDDVDLASEHLAPLVGLDEVRGELVALLLGDPTPDGQVLEHVALAHRVPLRRERWVQGVPFHRGTVKTHGSPDRER
jgi:hypothetical protein